MNMEGVGERWIVYFGKGGFWSIESMTLIMSFAIMITLVLIAEKSSLKEYQEEFKVQ